jgi:hypothetical protein
MDSKTTHFDVFLAVQKDFPLEQEMERLGVLPTTVQLNQGNHYGVVVGRPLTGVIYELLPVGAMESHHDNF